MHKNWLLKPAKALPNKEISFLSSVVIFFPTNSSCICLRKLNQAETVERVSNEADTPYDEITEVIDLPLRSITIDLPR